MRVSLIIILWGSGVYQKIDLPVNVILIVSVEEDLRDGN